MQELVYYSDSSTKITGEYARLGGKSYRLADLTSVSVSATQTDRARNVPSFLIVVGSLLMFSVTNLQRFFPVALEDMIPATSVLGMLIALAGLTVLIMQMVMKTDHIFILSINGTFGSACPFASDDEEYVRKIAQALNLAIKDRRSATSSDADLRESKETNNTGDVHLGMAAFADTSS
ncbi:MAG TPA: DUF6232 family protein [Chloroflexia bacterium]|nr:DUF6232 family protein [Chloroflexia bacterium]